MGSEIDELTLARARRGDSPALTALVRHYQRPVYALVGRLLVGRASEALDDVAQEAFIRVCKGLRRFEPEGRARGAVRAAGAADCDPNVEEMKGYQRP